MNESREGNALDMVGFREQHVKRYLKAHVLLLAQIYIVQSQWSYQYRELDDRKTITLLSNIQMVLYRSLY